MNEILYREENIVALAASPDTQIAIIFKHGYSRFKFVLLFEQITMITVIVVIKNEMSVKHQHDQDLQLFCLKWYMYFF